jgi:hypothetical protein
MGTKICARQGVDESCSMFRRKRIPKTTKIQLDFRQAYAPRTAAVIMFGGIFCKQKIPTSKISKDANLL